MSHLNRNTEATGAVVAPTVALDGAYLVPAAPGGCRFLGISERAFHELRKDPSFPKPVVLSKRCVRWRVADLIAYADRLLDAA